MQKHGEIIFSWIEDLLIAESKGPFNEEGMEYVNDELKKAILKKGLKHWRKLEILDEETMGSPAVLDIAKEQFEWSEEHGCHATAVVIKNALQRYAIEKVIQSASLKIFNDTEQAREWLSIQ